jgi:opacity protein-like surface antigen
MVSVKVAAIAGFAALFTTAATAADMPSMLPPVELPPIEDFAGGWYLRGDIGMSNQKVRSLDNALFTSAVNVVHKDFDSAPIFGLGIGYQWNDWLRFDVTGEYRGKSSFTGLDIVGGAQTNEYRALKSEWLFLANAYVDLGTWHSVTPFVGAGVGGSHITISNFTDTNVPNNGVAYAPSAGKWNFAWALHAGLAYKASPNLTFEFAYRYVHLGNGITGDIVAFDGTNAVYNPMHFKDITSHDLKFGIRWMFDQRPATPSIMLPPLMRRG